MNWTARLIGSYLARITFHHKHLVIVPNCSWPGAECDLLVVTKDLRIIDVEIKISRSDLKADAAKDKWFHSWDWTTDGPYDATKRRPREFPRQVWKHYYCFPQDIYQPELMDLIQPVSGVLLIRRQFHRHKDDFYIYVERQAKPNRQAEKISPEDAIDIARLASMRMWNAFGLVDLMRTSIGTKTESECTLP